MTVRYGPEATEDLDRIEQHYADRAGEKIAERLLTRIAETVERLISRNPRVGRLRPEFGPEIRSFPVLPYVVFYRVKDRNVFVIRILHGHRDIQPPLASLLLAI